MYVKTFYLRAKTCLTLLLVALCSLPSFADVTLDQLEFTLNNDGTGYTVRKKEGATLEGALTIPEIYNGLPITEIGISAFYGCKKITEIVIPNSVTSIGNGAFDSCSSLSKINIPNSVTSIGDWAFGVCTSLSEINIPNSVTTIGSHAFRSCSSLSKINIPNSVTYIGEEAFAYSGLRSLIIPPSVIKIGKYVAGNYGNVKIAYPEGLNYEVGDNWIKPIQYPRNAIIENGVIYDADKTKLYFADALYQGDYIIPSTVTEIGDYALANCNFAEMLIPPSVLTAGDNSFFTTFIKKTAFPEKFAKILDNAADPARISIPYPDDCIESGGMIYSPDKSVLYFAPSALTGEYTVPTELKEIGNYAFAYCDSISSIKALPTVPPTLGSDNFTNLFDKIPLEVSTASRGSYANAEGWGKFINIENRIVEDGDSIEVINEKAGDLIKGIDRSKLDKYVSLKISGPINSADLIMINRMPNLLSIDMSDATVEASARYYYQLDGVNYYTADDRLGSYWFNAIAPVEVRLPSVSALDQNALRNNAIESLTIPGTVQSIASSALAGNRLKTVILEAGEGAISCSSDNYLLNQPIDSVVYNRPVSSAIFSGCKSLRHLTIGESITEIGPSAFSGCIGLTDITIPASVSFIGSQAFQSCSRIKNLSLPESLVTIGSQAFQNCSSLEKLVLPESVTSIGAGAFRSCTSLDSLIIPESITTVSDETFAACTGLRSVVIPNSVNSIMSNAFNGCSSLTEIEFPSSLNTIASYAFAWCTGLKSVIIPNSVNSLYGNPFTACSGLIKSAYPDNLANPFSDGISVAYPKTGSVIENGWIFSADSTALYFAPVDLAGEYSIPEKVSAVNRSAFSGCSELESVIIPPSVTQIRDNAFSRCDKLSSVNISDMAAWCNITFSNAEANPLLTAHSLVLDSVEVINLVIPAGIQRINDYSFAGGSNLRSVSISEEIESIGIGAFSGCTSIDSISCFPATPPALVNESFDASLYDTAQLVVPEDSELDYYLHAIWGKFIKIKGTDLSGIEEIICDNDDTPYELYNLQGVRVDRDNVTPGIYIRRQGNKSTKIYMR